MSWGHVVAVVELARYSGGKVCVLRQYMPAPKDFMDLEFSSLPCAFTLYFAFLIAVYLIVDYDSDCPAISACV